MADPESPTPVKYFVAVLFSSPDLFAIAREVLQENWGKVDLEGEPRLFEVTDYYQAEMGSTLYRSIISFKDLMNPAEIVDRKLRCNELEDNLALDKKRRVNFDAGYLDHNKVVLASAKAAGQKIYLGRGIYADLAGRYRSGRYQPFEWSFPDFKDGRYDRELLSIREKYLSQLKNSGH